MGSNQTLEIPQGSMSGRFIVADDEPCPKNETMFQGFEWYCPSDHKHWVRLAKAIPSLAAIGITRMWIPPATKAASRGSNGYDIYDLFDLGEFNQKGSRQTKWGTKQELVGLVDQANLHGIGVLFDTVLNHKAGADYTETVTAVKVDSHDRNKVTGRPEKIETWTGYQFKGRGSMYSNFKWNKNHFTGIDFDNKSRTKSIWRFQGKRWANDVSHERGNYDYLMFADMDHASTEVRQELFNWGEWLGGQLNLGGLRLDAIKHYSLGFIRDFVSHLDQTVGKNWFVVGEYWSQNSKALAQHIEYLNHRISLFDVRLVSNFSRLSMSRKPDLRTVFDGSLAALKPDNTVTFVVNHDTQERQSLETPVAPYFIPIAYALILLRTNAGQPCVFYSDLYGSLASLHAHHFNANSFPMADALQPPISGGNLLPRLILTRNLFAYGTQVDFFDSPTCIGFTRLGHPSQSSGAGLAALLNVGWEYGSKRMFVGRRHAEERWTDVLKQASGFVDIDADGWGLFYVPPRGIAVWASEKAEGRRKVDDLVFDSDIYGLGI